MTNYSQNQEQEHILKYFGEFKGTLCDIGANDGKTFSNSLALIERGWKALLFEPSPKAFAKLTALHEANNNVICICKAVGIETGTFTLHESGPHLPDQSDFSLLSTLDAKEKARWKGSVEFTPIEVDVITVDQVLSIADVESFDFITIDAEGLDIEILKTFDLGKTKLVCVEWNGNYAVKDEIIEYCMSYGLWSFIYESGENIIIGK
jgi:FkbM family methyltransferase